MVPRRGRVPDTVPDARVHVALLAAAVVLVLVSHQAGGQQPETGVLEATALRAQNALQSLWRRARGEADAVVSNVVDGFHRQEHDALTAASLQLEKLGVDLDLNETGDEVEEDVLGCAHAAQERYVGLLSQIRRRVQRCWGWEGNEVAALRRAVEDLVLAGDRLPALLRANMARCLQPRARRARRDGTKGTSRYRPSRATDAAEARQAAERPPMSERGRPGPPPPSPFRVLRCTADSVNLTWTFVSSVPREVGRAARKTAALLGSSREDWAACGRAVVRQAAGSAVRTLRDLGACVADRVSEQSWMQLYEAWKNPKKKRRRRRKRRRVGRLRREAVILC